MVAGSNPAGRTRKQVRACFLFMNHSKYLALAKIRKIFYIDYASHADLAQLVEQPPCKRQVVGPSPTVGSKGVKPLAL